MSRELTAKQKAVLEFIAERIRTSGSAPTIREIGRRFGMKSTNAVRDVLNALQKKGHIIRHRMVSRGIELVRRGAGPADIIAVPLVGNVAAGVPITAIENIEGSYALDRSFVPGEDIFLLRIQGDSMSGDGIFDGDFVLVRQQRTAERGDIVVAVIDDEATVKRYYPENGRIRLQPSNDAYGPIIVEDLGVPGFYIAGKVIGLLRRM